MLTAALLKYPSNRFNIVSIANLIAPLLADHKRRARLAAFELYAVLAQTLRGMIGNVVL
jgi:hypothetical protein